MPDLIKNPNASRPGTTSPKKKKKDEVAERLTKTDTGSGTKVKTTSLPTTGQKKKDTVAQNLRPTDTKTGDSTYAQRQKKNEEQRQASQEAKEKLRSGTLGSAGAAELREQSKTSKKIADQFRWSGNDSPYWNYIAGEKARQASAAESRGIQLANQKDLIEQEQRKDRLRTWGLTAAKKELEEKKINAENAQRGIQELTRQMNLAADKGDQAAVLRMNGQINILKEQVESYKQFDADYKYAESLQYLENGRVFLDDMQETDPATFGLVDTIARSKVFGIENVSGNLAALTVGQKSSGDVLNETISKETVDEAYKKLRAAGYQPKDIEQWIDWQVRLLNEEQARDIIAKGQQFAHENPVEATLGGRILNPFAGAGMLEATADTLTGKPIDVNSSAMLPGLLNQAMTEQVSQDIMEKHPGAGGQLLNFLYTSGVSMADSTVNATLAGVGIPQQVGLLLMSGSAGVSALKEAQERGLTDSQALSVGFVAAAAEYITERIELNSLLDILNGKGDPLTTGQRLRKILTNRLKQAHEEGREEVMSDLINFTVDLMAFNGSQFNPKVKQYEAAGYSNYDAIRMALIDQAKDTAMSYAGGFLSGWVMGGAAGYINTASNAKVTNDYYTGLAAGKGTVAYDAAQNLRRVIDEIDTKSEDEITMDDHAAYQAAVNGLTDALDALPDADIKEARKEGKALKKADKEAARTKIGELLGIRQALEQFRHSTDVELDNKKYHQNGIVQNAAALVATGKQKNISSAVSTVMKSPEAIEALGLSFEKKTSNTQKRTQILTALKELVAQAQETQPTETPVEVNNSTEEVTTTETPAAVSEEAVPEEAPMSETLPSYEEYEKGVLENNPEAIPEQIKQWYADLSQAYEDVQQEQQAKQTVEEQAKQVEQDIKERQGKRVYIKEAKKAVDYRTFRRWSLGYAKADGESYTEAEIRTAFDAGVAATQAETAKYEVKRRKGVTDASNRIDKAFKKNQLGIGARVSFDATEFGGTSATEHAFYDPKTKSVVFNGDILDTEAALVYYLGHEVVHPAAQVDAGLADAIIETFQQLEEAGKLRGELSRLMRNFDAELKTLQKEYQDHENELAKRDKREARTFDESYAREEFAANLMRYAFSHTKLFKDIAGRRPGLVARMKQSVGRVMRAVAGDEELDTMLQGIADRLDEALKKVPNANLLEYNPETITDEALTEQNIESLNEQNDGRLFSFSTMRQDLDGYMQDLRDAGLVGEGKPMSDQDLTDLFNGINKVMDYVEDHIDEIERNENYRNMTAGNRPFNPYKNNADPHYKLALDFSTLCRKRLLTQAITERLQGALKRALTPVEQVKVRDMIKKLQAEGKKIDVACALCYVEAARLKSPKVINDFLNNRAKTIWLYHSLKDSTFKRDVYQKRSGDWKEQHGLPRNATKAEMKAAGVSVKDYNKFLVSIRDNYQSWLQQNNPERYAQLARSVAAAEAMDASEFLNAQSLARMRNNPDLVDIYDAFITKIREATRSKAQETDVPYVRGDVNQVGQSLIDQMNEESGFRHQSWSDFQAMHLLDTVAAIMELATRGAKMHTYTKVADMVRFLGETGMMMNMSLIPAGETGFDENGNLLFDPVEGMDYQTMLDLRRKFHSTAGNIAIGISDAQILAMLNSPEIDYIIPYHTSGLNADMRRRMGIRAWKDYTQSQNEKGDDWDKKAPKLREWFNESEALLAPDGVAYMVDASRKYLQLCHERGLVPKFPQFLTKNSDGSYSLRDDAQNYWKLLIDRKMVDQYTGGIIQQKAVLPKFNVNTMMDILQNEVNSEAARDAREAEDYIVNKVLTEGMGVVTKEELERARIIRDATARVAVENAAEEMGFGKRHSIEYAGAQDAEYLDLAKDPVKNAARLQEMVDKAAKAAGYKKETYHGTTEHFTEFREYGRNEVGYHVGTKNAAEDRVKYSLNKNIMHLYTNIGKTIRMPDVFGLWHGVHDYVLYVVGNEDGMVDRELVLKSKKATAKYNNEGVFQKNDAYYAMVEAVKNALDYKPSHIAEAVKAQREYLLSLGIDSVSYTNKYEAIGSKSYMLLHANQVKSADPVTYDDNGNVIPLSQRFDSSKQDIRYSIAKAPGEDTTLHIPDGMANGEVVSFTDLILDGKKLGETRGLNVHLPVGRWIGIDKNGQVVGRVILGEPKRITNQSPEYEDAYIKGTKYDLADGEEKLYYPIVDVVDMRNDPKPVLRSSARYGVYQTGETGRQFSDPETGENVRYSLHVGEDPEPLRNPDGSVKYVYKAFYVLDGKLYPPMVANQTDENKKKKNVKGKVSGTQLGLDTPVGVWLDADVGRLARYGKDATEYDVALRRRWNGSSKEIKRIKETLQKQGINTKRGLTEEVRQAAVPLMEQVFPELRQASKTNIVERKGELVRNGSGRLAVENAKGGGTLAFRPGWHLGEWPDAKQFNVKGGLMPATLVFARCEISGDIDYQLAAMELGMTESGGYDRTQAGLPSVPVDGYYKYRTNADPTTAPWYIAGSMRVVEILDDEECARVCREFGVEPSPREGGPIDLEAHGIKAGKVSPTEDLAPYQKSESVVQNAETLRAALADERYANAYTPRQLNFGDKEIQAEFARNRQDAGYYQAEYEKLGGKLASDSVGRRFSISPTYGHSIDLWDERGRPNDWTFTLGTTGDVLRALGAQERDIYMTAEKISQILVDHPNMTLEEIKNVPKVLENPTLILKSLGQSAQGHNTRLVVYGDLTDTNNVPVAVIFDLAPSESGVLVSDMYKVSSAYGKDDVNTPKAIEKSDVLYANKKRAPHLLRKLGFTESSVRVPGLLSAQGSGAGYSSLGSINDAAGNVNTNGTPFGQVFDYRYAIDSEDDDLFQAFVAAYEATHGTGQLKKDYPTIEQQLREARRELARAEKKAESEHAKRLVAEKVTKKTREAWQLYAKKTVQQKSEKFKAKLEAERQAKRDAVKAEREKAKAKLEETKLAERMNAGKKAAKRLGVKDDAYGKLKENVKERAILRRNSGLSALRNKDLAEQKRNVIETQQGPIDTMRKSPQERTFREKVADAAEKLRVTGRDLYAKFVSQSAAIERVTRRQRGPLGASTLATIVGGVNSTVGHVFNKALVDKGGDVIGASFTDTFICTENDAGKVMDEPRQALLQEYLLHRHNVDRMSFVARAEERLEQFEQQQPWLAEMNDKEFARLVALTDKEAEKLGKEEARRLAREYSRLLQELAEATDKEVFADLEGNPITAETSRERVAQLEREAPWLIEKAAGIDEWWDKFMRAWVVGTSITEEQYDHMREIYPHYVPTYRKDKGGFGFSFSSSNGATPGQFTKRATGSVKEIINVEDSFANLVQKGIKQARINELYQNLVDTAMLDHDGTFADMMFFDWFQYGRDIQEAARIDIGDHIDERDTAGLSKDGDGYRVSAWYDGELIHTYVSEELFKSLSLTVGHASDRLDKLARLGSALTSPMKTAITGINPNFALRNMARDIPTAIVNSVSGLAFPKYWAMAWGEIWRNSEHWQRYQALGGGDALYYNNEGGYGKATNMTKGTKGSIQRGWNTVKGKVGWFNEITESVTRFAEYLATIERLGDTYEGRLQARKNAAEVTVDFSRHGEYGKAINAWIPYWNPAVQGIDKVIRSVVETKEGEAKLAHAMKTIGKAAVTTALLDAILHAVLTALGKEKDWEELDDRTKDTYYCIPYADHKYIKIPKNREWGAILGTPLVRLWEWGFNGRSNPFENYFETSFWPNFMPGMPLMMEDGKLRSDIIGISQALDLANNTDFAGRTIIPYAYQQGSKAGQYNAETSQFTKWLSDALGNKLSPMQLDYIIKDYFGDFGKMFTQATSIGLLSGEVSPEDVADYALSIIVNPWKADNRFSNQYMSKYYEIRDELEDKVNDLKNHAEGDSYKDTIKYKTYQALTKGLGKDISDLNKSIRNETDEEVKGRVKGQMVELAQQAIEFYNDSMAGKIKDPELVVAYRDLPQAVSEALIKLDDLTKDYSIKPSENNTDTAVDTHGLKIGSTVVTQYKLDDEAKKVRSDLRAQYYDEYMLKAINSSAFKSASKEKQAEMLEDAKSDAYKEAADDFSEWLTKNRKPELKDERELPKAYKALSSSTRTELTNLYGKPGTEKYTFTPADNTAKSYSDPDSKQGTKTTMEYKLDDEALAYYDKLRQDYYESYVSKAMRSSAYKKASDVRKAEILAEARKQAYDDAREQLMKWLKKNRKSTPKD